MAALQLRGSARAGSRGRRARASTWASSAARSPYDAPRSLTASSLRKVSIGIGLGEPVGEDLSAGVRDGVDASCPGGRSAGRLDGDPAVVLHAREHAVDLLVGGVPEEADRLLEAPRELEAGRGPLAEGDEERVFEGHGSSAADLCNELQGGASSRTCWPKLPLPGRCIGQQPWESPPQRGFRQARDGPRDADTSSVMIGP